MTQQLHMHLRMYPVYPETFAAMRPILIATFTITLPSEVCQTSMLRPGLLPQQYRPALHGVSTDSNSSW